MLPGKNWATIMNRALEFLQAVYTNDDLPLVTRMRAAMACLPFEAPKLAVTAIIDSERDFAVILDRRIKRLQEMEAGKLIEAKPQPNAVEVKPPMPRLADRRYRRF